MHPQLHVRHFTTAEIIALENRLDLVSRIEHAVDRPQEDRITTECLRALIVSDLRIPQTETPA